MSATRFSWHALTLELIVPFRLSYGVSETRQVFWLRLAEDAGWGESAIPPYYHITQAEIVAFWEQMARQDASFPDDPAEIAAWVGAEGPAPARCALDIALHDRIGEETHVITRHAEALEGSSPGRSKARCACRP
jgi:L-alanine-DL-glutamate epimerase-like enolase superfamily enzyme